MWKRRFFRLQSAATALVLAGCTTPSTVPAPQALARWTVALRDAQPEDAFAAVYKVDRKRLVFVGAKHANRHDSRTFSLIRDAYANFRFDTVIAEGFATSRGPNPASVIKYALESKIGANGFVEGGETVPTVLGAMRQQAVLLGGEPDDLSIKTRTSASGVSDRDLLGFYVLRSIPQWISERKIKGAGDAALQPLVEAELVRKRAALQVPATVLPSFADWVQWYTGLNGKALGEDFQTEEVGPLADGRFGTNRVAYEVSRARDTHLHQLTVDRLNVGENVLAVFGASHLLIQKPALDAALGPTCYLGPDLKKAKSACR